MDQEDEIKTDEGSRDKNQSRVLAKENEEFFYESVAKDLLAPLFESMFLLQKNPPRKSKTNTVTLEEKYRFLQKQNKDVQTLLTEGLQNWNCKYEQAMREHLYKKQIANAKQKLTQISDSGKNEHKSKGLLQNKASSKRNRKIPKTIKLSRKMLKAMEHLDTYYSD